MTDAGALPAWLEPVVVALDTLGPEQLSPRFPHPPADARAAAVLVLFAAGAQGPELLFTERPEGMRQHARQISFPGGRAEPEDTDLVHTALREADEEIGLDAATVDVIGQLPRIWLPPTNHAVTAVLAYWANPHPIERLSQQEVKQVLQVPIATLTDPARRYTMVHPSGWQGPAFDVDADVPLWGFTAGIVDRLLDQVGWSRPWDHSRQLPLPETR